MEVGKTFYLKVTRIEPNECERCQYCLGPLHGEPVEYAVDDLMLLDNSSLLNTGLDTYACSAHLGDLLGNLVKAE